MPWGDDIEPSKIFIIAAADGAVVVILGCVEAEAACLSAGGGRLLFRARGKSRGDTRSYIKGGADIGFKEAAAAGWFMPVRS